MSWLANRRRGVVGGGQQPDIYEGCVTLEFTESVGNNVRQITADNRNVLTYLDYIIIDGVEFTPTKNYQHTFGIGNHKIGWKFVDDTIYKDVIGRVFELNDSDKSTTTLIVPANIIEVKAYGLRNFPCAYGPQNVYVLPTTPPVAGSLSVQSLDRNKSKPLYVPTSSVDAYKVADGWSQYADYIIAIPT